jgi:enterochelin esterase-like enzyme
MKRILTILLFVSAVAAAEEGTLSPNTRTSSATLGYDLQYRVYAPVGIETASNLPVLFVTDGPGYIQQGKMTRVLDRMIRRGDIEPLVTVFVDARDPDKPRSSRRNAQFLCNKDYLKFYVEELIPEIEQSYPVGRSREHRGILGLSFGATNAACFGLLGYETFADIGMHSPANHPVEPLLPAYEEMPLLPLRIFLSTGTPDDNTQANRKFHKILEDKGYPMKYVEVREGHNWDNWRPLIDDVLLYFYSASPDATE